MVLTEEERRGMTVWGTTMSAQVRDGELALYIGDDTPRSSENYHPYLLPLEDVSKLYHLLSEAARRDEIKF